MLAICALSSSINLFPLFSIIEMSADITPRVRVLDALSRSIASARPGGGLPLPISNTSVSMFSEDLPVNKESVLWARSLMGRNKTVLWAFIKRTGTPFMSFPVSKRSREAVAEDGDAVIKSLVW